MSSILALFFLLFAFGVLLYTFVWIARLLARRAEEAQRSSSPDAEDPAGPAEEEGGEPEQDEQTEAEIEQEQLQEKGVAMRSSATLGLILGILACLLVSFGPLIVTLSIASFYFSAQAIWVGLRYFRIFVIRAVFGVAFALGSVGLQYLALTGQLVAIPLVG